VAKPADVRKQIKSRNTAPLYLLEGDDPQSRDELAQEFASLVADGLEAFNVHSFHGVEATSQASRDTMMSAIVAAARTLPMMAPRRVVLVHDAERLLSPRKGRDEETAEPERTGRRPRAISPAEELEAYIERPEPLATVVFAAGALDASRRLVKLLRKHAEVVTCGVLDSPQEAARWIQQRLAQDGLGIDQKAVGVLIQMTGLDQGRIRAELDKLALYAAGERQVTVAHVRDVVTPPNEPGEDFALGRAIWNGDAPTALREVGAALDTGAQPPMVLGQIRAATIRLKPDARARRGLDAVFQTDLALKSSGSEPRYLLERLVVELCGR
jgi:DNA polymerase-3 subunit delta